MSSKMPMVHDLTLYSDLANMPIPLLYGMLISTRRVEIRAHKAKEAYLGSER